MRDHGNMPRLNWHDQESTLKAKAQILRQEPVILRMPEDFRFDVDYFAHGCKCDSDTGIYYDCDADGLLEDLASSNHSPALHDVAEMCRQTSALVDVDTDTHSVIVHD